MKAATTGGWGVTTMGTNEQTNRVRGQQMSMHEMEGMVGMHIHATPVAVAGATLWTNERAGESGSSSSSI